MEDKLRKTIYVNTHQLVHMPVGREYEMIKREDYRVPGREIFRRSLVSLISHCAQHVPYYSRLMSDFKGFYQDDPETYLRQFPILTKEHIRRNFPDLTSTDLEQRKWFYNTSGGSTGEPVQLIQDKEFAARSGAVQWLSFNWAGRKFGERGIRLWGSERDILQGSLGLKMNLVNWMTNDTWLNAFHMTPQSMRQFIQILNERPPQLIIAYAQAIYELARFVEQAGLEVVPQKAILTSAGMLYPFMREKIEGVFQCRVFNRYGSREVGDIACECQEHQGLHVFPWSSYVEVVDEDGQAVPAGVEGNLLVTCLTNYAMPLVRYAIGDRGVLLGEQGCACGRSGQRFEKISGRNVDTFEKEDGTLVDSCYFIVILFHREWVKKYQVIQKDHDWIHYKVVKSSKEMKPGEEEDLIEKTRALMGDGCRVTFEFVEDIPASNSGKFRYTISEVRYP